MSCRTLLIICLWALVSKVKSAKQYHELLKENEASRLPVNLIGGVKENEGFLGLLHGNVWHYVCNVFWDFRNSKVICRELGYTKVIYVSIENRTSLNDIEQHPFLQDEITCEGSEPSILRCRRNRIESNQLDQLCSINTKVYIKCSEEKENDAIFIAPQYKKNALRLQCSDKNIDTVSSGKLQIELNGTWYDLCIDGWNEHNSHVACLQLGFSGFKTFTASSTKQINTKYFHQLVNCSKEESVLSQCLTDHENICNNEKSVILTCQVMEVNHIIEEKNGLLRLRGGFNEGSGRVEIFDGQEWGTICDDEWDLKDANVVCRQLGLGSAYKATHWADDGEGLGKIILTKVSCHGNETDIRDCKSSKTANLTCTHAEDAGVRCHIPENTRKTDLRLIGGTETSGRIEVWHKNHWYSICGIGFSLKEGVVACRHLGLGFSSWAGRSYSYGINDKKLMYNVRCYGNETNLFQCQYKTFGRCRYYDMASVICTKYAPDLLMDIHIFKESIKVESHTLHELKCSYEERCLSPIVDSFYDTERQRIRHLLKFSSRFLNKGAVSFRPHNEKDDWIYHKCHDHYHSMETFAQYDIIDINGARVADGHKASFCLEDSECYPGFKKVFNCTNKGDQGISVNCADNYKNTIDCQWIDITELKEGNYSLRVNVNPLINVAESDYLNNRAVCEIQYYDGKAKVQECTTDPCFQESFGGNSFGHCCYFPFKYKNKLYYKCITGNDRETPWCSTTFNYDEDRKWGYCEER